MPRAQQGFVWVIAGLGCACAPSGAATRSAPDSRGAIAHPPSATPTVALDATMGHAPARSRAAPEPPPRGDEPRRATTAEGGYRDLEVPGFLPALLYVPDGAPTWPLFVVTHGAGGTPEADCGYWRLLTGGRALLACVRGTPIDERNPSGFYYRDHFALGREFVALSASLTREFGAEVAREPGVYAGFSQGAIMGAPMIVPHARSFPRLALIEGGYQYISQKSARRYAQNGGRRVLFVCGTSSCRDGSQKPAEWLRQARVAVRVEYAVGAGHTPLGDVMKSLEASLPWLLEG